MTSETDDTREGKGRVHPGPSSSAEIRSKRQPDRSARTRALLALGVLVTLGATAASTVFGTTAHQYSSPGAMALVCALGAFAGVAVVFGLPKERPGAVREWLPAAIAGAGGFALAPWLVMANRYTDAPPGSEVVFLTTAAWGALLAVALAFGTRQRISRAGGAVLALAGAAALVANWERPSSFSPFVRFQREELLMLFAGVLFTGLVLVLVRAAARRTLPVTALVAAVGGVGGGVALAAAGLATGSLARADFGVPGLAGYGISTGLAVAGMLMLLRSQKAEGIAVAYLLVPAGISTIIMLEQATGPLGPQPIVVGPALASIACGLAGAWITAVGGGSAVRVRRTPVAVASAGAGALAVAAALVALARPAMRAAVEGLRADGAAFAAAFDLMGYESAGPWLALGVAIVAFGMALEGAGWRRAWPRTAAVALALAAWCTAARTPLRTLTSFIPSDVQVDYGSEYARITFAGGVGLAAVVALGAAVVALVLAMAHGPQVAEAGDGVDDQISRGGSS